MEIFNTGGNFTFPTNKLIKNQKGISGTSRKRNPLIPKSYYPNYTKTRIINKASKGKKFEFGTFNALTTSKDSSSSDTSINWWSKLALLTSYNPNSIIYDPLADTKSLDDILTLMTLLYITFKPTTRSFTTTYPQGSIGMSGFKSAYSQVAVTNPDASKYEHVLTGLAETESGFNPKAQSSKTPAYGLFQFMEGEYGDGKTLTNITDYAKKYSTSPEKFTINEFLANPNMLINAAIDLAKDFDSLFTLEDRDKAKKLGLSNESLIAGAWLGGVNGVRRVLNGEGNPKDAYGTDILSRMKQFSK